MERCVDGCAGAEADEAVHHEGPDREGCSQQDHEEGELFNWHAEQGESRQGHLCLLLCAVQAYMESWLS